MRLVAPSCPECQGPAIGVLETLPCTSHIIGDPREGPVQPGPIDIDWNMQDPALGAGGHPLVVCAQLHQWESEILLP
jgi:hypothetical protein